MNVWEFHKPNCFVRGTAHFVALVRKLFLSKGLWVSQIWICLKFFFKLFWSVIISFSFWRRKDGPRKWNEPNQRLYILPFWCRHLTFFIENEMQFWVEFCNAFPCVSLFSFVLFSCCCGFFSFNAGIWVCTHLSKDQGAFRGLAQEPQLSTGALEHWCTGACC